LRDGADPAAKAAQKGGTSMRMKTFMATMAFVSAAAVPLASAAHAQDTIYVPLLTYRTGPFAGSGIPVANGMADYLNMINERDGGVGGVRLTIEECETGYDTKKGVECYEQVKSKHPVMVNPWSTGITLQLIPKAGVDHIPILSMAYGLSAAADGNTFPWVFNPPDTYWDGASVFVKYAAEVEGGLDKLKGKTIALIYLDAPYGKEPIPLLQDLGQKYGFELKLYPVAASEMQNQGSLWLNVRRDRPDWIFIQGWGAMNPTAVNEAVKTGFKMDRLVGNWYASGDDDVRPAGDSAKGMLSLNFNAVGQNFPAMQDIQKLIVAKGKSQVTSPDKVGENFYNRGVYNSMIIAEAIRSAQQVSGKKVVTGDDLRRGLESLNIDEGRMAAAGLAGFGSTVKVSCTDHSGENKIYIQQWDGKVWVKKTDGIEPMREVVRPLIEAAAKDYAEKNSGWPKRTEACDKSS
jgi:branched-chain amino acid transport system substrate-binding protein